MCHAVSLGAGTPPSVQVFVTLSGFFAYFEHRRRAPNLATAAVRPPPPLFFCSRRRYPRSRRSRPSTSFVFVQHQPVASVVVIYPVRFIYSYHRGRHWPVPIGAATIVESFSAGFSDFFDMAYSSCRS